MGCPCKNKQNAVKTNVQKTSDPVNNGKAGAGRIEKRVIH